MTDPILVSISWVEPPTQSLVRSAPPPAASSLSDAASVEVSLPTVLRDVPEHVRTVRLDANPQRMQAHVNFCMASAGWAGVVESHNRLLEAQAPQATLQASYQAVEALLADTFAALAAIESRAHQLLAAELQLGLEQLRFAAVTFLTPRNLKSYASREEQAKFFRDIGELKQLKANGTKTTLLRNGEHHDALMALLVALEQLNEHVAHQTQRLRAIKQYERVVGKEAIERYSADLTKARVERARAVHEVAVRWPLAAWLTDLAKDVSAEDLWERVCDELGLIAESWLFVAEQVGANAKTGAASRAAPTLAAKRFKTPAVPLRPRPPSAQGRAILPPGLFSAPAAQQPYEHRLSDSGPFRTVMDPPQGVWRYPRIIDAAMKDLGYQPPSAVTTAVTEVTEGDVGPDLLYLLNGGIMVLGILSPPLGALVSVVASGWNLMDVWDEQVRKEAGHRAMIDPARTLSTNSSMLDVINASISLAGDLIPGWGGFVVSGLGVGFDAGTTPRGP